MTEQVNYVQRVIDALAERLDDCDDDLLGIYALLVLTRGLNTTLSDVHDGWAVWRNTDNPKHKDLVPFRELPPDRQLLDKKYLNVIHEVSKLGLMRRV
jgi:hypothetical protein